MTKLPTPAISVLAGVALPLLATTCGREPTERTRPTDSTPELTEASTRATLQSEAERQAERELIDPRNSRWKSEAFANEAGTQLENLARLLESADGVSLDGLSELAVEFVSGNALRPRRLEEVFEAPSVRVRRTRGASGVPRTFTGIEECAAALEKLVVPMGRSSGRRVSLKIGQVSMEADLAETSVSYSATGRTPSGMLQQTAQWNCRWLLESNGPPRLLSIEAGDLEEVETRGGSWFSDITAPVLGGNPAFREQVAHGLNHWLGRIDRAYGLNYFRRHGVAIGDANGDGLDDIYLCQPGGLPNRLFLHNEDGTAIEASAKFGVDWLDNTASALFVDLDNDGDQDLALAVRSRVQILENLENKSFVQRAPLLLLDNDTLSLSAIDYDSDGDLDLFVCVGFADKNAHAKRGRNLPGFVFHNAEDGGRNALFRNDGGWQFFDATEESGLGANNLRHSLAASWEDYDKDGDADLYIANDYGPNSLYRNSGGHFEEVAGESGVLDYGAGMSVSWGDYDRDGWMDLYVANMFSYAGNRIAGQPEFLNGQSESLREINRRFAKGNSLFKNSPRGVFAETGGTAGVEKGRWAWGSLFADINNDGWEDLFVANGYITTPDTGDL